MTKFTRAVCLSITGLCLCALAYGAADTYPFKMKQGIRLDIEGDTQPAPKPKPKPKPKTAPPPVAAPPAEVDAGPTVNFEGEKYTLGYSVRDNAGMWLNEYFRKGDANFESWIKLIGVYYYQDMNITPMQVARSMANNLQTTNPAAKYSLTQDSKTGDIMLDFFTWTPGNGVIEFNVFKISKFEGNTISLQFARRWYDDGTGAHQQEFADSIKTLRPLWLEELRRMPIPAPVKTVKN